MLKCLFKKNQVGLKEKHPILIERVTYISNSGKVNFSERENKNKKMNCDIFCQYL